MLLVIMNLSLWIIGVKQIESESGVRVKKVDRLVHIIDIYFIEILLIYFMIWYGRETDLEVTKLVQDKNEILTELKANSELEVRYLIEYWSYILSYF